MTFRRRASPPAALCLSILLPTLAAAPAAAEQGRPGRHALLIGCTRYPNLPEKAQLSGAPHDAALLRDLLKKRYQFTDDDFRVLSEAEAGARKDDRLRPTRANIEREMAALADRVRPGDQVVIWMSGHGCQEPIDKPRDAKDDRPGGLHQVFLPEDCGAWDQDHIPGAILDFELRAWTGRIADKKTSVLVLMDACHSGTSLRDLPPGRPKEILPQDLKVPAGLIEKARKRSVDAGDDPRRATMGLQRGDNGVVALYASRPFEKTYEVKRRGPDGTERPYGLFTFYLCQVLLDAPGPLTYREVVQQVRARYANENWDTPVPLAERDMDVEFLGQKKALRISFQLRHVNLVGWRIDGGALHGLTPGSILAVRPAEGKDDKVLGHVRIKTTKDALDDLSAEVEPTDANDKAYPPARLDDTKRTFLCHPVYVEYGDLRPRVAVVPAEKVGAALDQDRRAALGKRLADRVDAAREVVKALRPRADEPGAPFRLVEDPAGADWLVLVPEGKPPRFRVTPAAGLVATAGEFKVEWAVRAAGGGVAVLPEREGPRTELELDSADKVAAALERIARVELLRKLALAPDHALTDPDEVGGGVLVEIKLFRHKDGDLSFGATDDPNQPGVKLRRHERLTCEVVNRSRDKVVYVTILKIDSDFVITQVYPKPNRYNLRIAPNHAVLNARVEVGTKAARGPEHLLVLALDASAGEPVDFSFLTRPTAEGAQKSKGHAKAVRTPLGQLLDSVVFVRGATKGVKVGARRGYVMLLRSWMPAE